MSDSCRNVCYHWALPSFCFKGLKVFHWRMLDVPQRPETGRHAVLSAFPQSLLPWTSLNGRRCSSKGFSTWIYIHVERTPTRWGRDWRDSLASIDQFRPGQNRALSKDLARVFTAKVRRQQPWSRTTRTVPVQDEEKDQRHKRRVYWKLEEGAQCPKWSWVFHYHERRRFWSKKPTFCRLAVKVQPYGLWLQWNPSSVHPSNRVSATWTVQEKRAKMEQWRTGGSRKEAADGLW